MSIEPDANLIIDNLWLGNKNVSDDKYFIQKFNIKYIINATPNIKNHFKNISYLRVPIKNRKEYISLFRKYIDKSYKFIDNGLKHGGILVHCKAGHKRSALIIAYYLMKKYNLSFEESRKYINNIRPLALDKDIIIQKAFTNF